MRIQRARHTGKRRCDCKTKGFVIGRMNTAGLRGNFVFPNGENGASMPGTDERYDDINGNHHNDKRPDVIGVPLNTGQTEGSAGDAEIDDDNADDFTEAQRDNGQIVAAQAKCRETD